MRDFVAARDRGDDAAMRRYWGLLLTEGWDRLRGFVSTSGSKILSPAEREDALQNASLRMTQNVIWIFKGSTPEEFGGMLKTVAWVACHDEQRNAARYWGKKRSLDAPFPGTDEDGGSWADTAFAELSAKRQAEDEDLELEREFLAFARGFLQWALPQVPSTPRKVFELMLAGRSPAEIMEELGMERNTVDQNKRRAIQKLIQLKEQYKS